MPKPESEKKKITNGNPTFREPPYNTWIFVPYHFLWCFTKKFFIGTPKLDSKNRSTFFPLNFTLIFGLQH